MNNQTFPKPDYSKLAEADAKSLAVAFSAIMKNPLMPTKLFNVIADEINLTPDWRTPEVFLYNIEEMNKEESEKQT